MNAEEIEWGIEYASRCLSLDDFNICRCPHNAGKPCTYDACPKRRRRMQ